MKASQRRAMNRAIWRYRCPVCNALRLRLASLTHAHCGACGAHPSVTPSFISVPSHFGGGKRTVATLVVSDQP